MPGRFPMLREAALALFLVAVALGLWLADLRPLAVVGVMTLALAVAWVIEWVSWREDQLQGMRPVREEIRTTELPGDPAPPEPAPPAPAPRARGLWLLRGARSRPPARPTEEVGEGHAPPAPTEAVEPEEAPVAPVEPEAPPAEPPPTQEPPPSRRRLQPVRSAAPPPPPAPEPEQPPQQQPEPQGAPIVPLWARSTQPREWNLWDLERIARAQSRRDPEHLEEWSYLFLHLRRFANADGMLPAEFDGLVREYFGGLLEPAQGA